jgi:glycosyltransferase involved in cell wall biosynthesis
MTRVFLHELAWDMRSRSTDWRYVRYALPQINRFEPDLAFISEKSRTHVLQGNYSAIHSAVVRRLGLRPSLYRDAVSTLPLREVRSGGGQVVFSRTFPVNAGDIPVVWENAIVDPEMQRSYGADDAYMKEAYEVRAPLFRRATAVQVFTDAEAKRHAAMFPDIAEKFVAVPWFAPHIHACEPQELEKHRGAAPVRILFVGNHAARKGLDKLFEAFVGLPKALQQRCLLTVVSHFDRSNIAIPTHDQIRVVKGMPSAAVMEEMRRAHIFVNVARLETYGVVFHEAMAQGVACLAPRWEVQRELFDDGRAGLNLACEADAIRHALEMLITDEEYRYQLAVAGWKRFKQRYAAEVVAGRYAALFRSAAGGATRD